MDHSFFDPSTLSDEQLQEKLNQLGNRANSANYFGMSSQLLDQLYMYIDMINDELYVRYQKQVDEEMNKLFTDVDTEKTSKDTSTEKKSRFGSTSNNSDKSSVPTKFQKTFKNK